MSYLDLARSRYSVRMYEARPVEPEKIDAIVEAGRIAPSACNRHPSRVLVCDTPELLERAASCEERFARDGSLFGAPLVLVVCSAVGDAWTRPYDGKSSSDIDATIVCDQMMMAATDLGLGTCWICHFDPERAREAFGLPDGLEPVNMLAVGYAADTIADSEKREARCISREDFVL